MTTYSTVPLLKGRLFWAADDGLVGWLLAEPRELPYGEVTAGRHYLEIRELHVVDTHRRRGIGSALVHEAFDWALSNGFSHVNVEVGARNAEANEFWASIGFERRSIMYDIELE